MTEQCSCYFIKKNSNGCQGRRLAPATEHTSQGWPASSNFRGGVDGEISGPASNLCDRVIFNGVAQKDPLFGYKGKIHSLHEDCRASILSYPHHFFYWGHASVVVWQREIQIPYLLLFLLLATPSLETLTFFFFTSSAWSTSCVHSRTGYR